MAYRIIRNDITKVAADVIVNSANPRPICGGSTEAAIYDAAGYDELLEARQEIGCLEVGKLGVTPAFNLPAKNIVHISCPWWNDENPEEASEVLASCYGAAIEKALKLGAKSVAFPLLSSGVYRFPKEVALAVATSTFKLYEKEDIEIILVVYDSETFAISSEFAPDLRDYLQEPTEYFCQMPTSPRKSSKDVCEKSFDEESICDERVYEEDIREDGDGDFLSERSICDTRIREEAEPTPPAKISDCCIVAPSVAASPKAPEGLSVPKFLEGYATFKSPAAKSASKKASSLDLEDEIGAVIMSMDDDSFQEKMMGYIEKKGMDPATVYRAANLDRKLFSKVKKEGYIPSKNTVLALAIGLELNLEETTDLLSRANHAFSPANKRDVIIRHFIQREDLYKKGVFRPIDVINDYLTCFQEDPLGES